MKSLALPDGLPVLGRGKHRTPRRGACFMELASVIGGERWSDHPPCTHPLLAQLARLVNDHTTDAGRHRLVPLVPSVIGRVGDETSSVTISVAVSSRLILEVPEGTQRVLAAGLLRAEEQCQALGPAMDGWAERAGAALDLVPGAVDWVEQFGTREPIVERTYALRCAPTMVRSCVQGVVTSGCPDTDDRLLVLLEAGIAACSAPARLPSGRPPIARIPTRG